MKPFDLELAKKGHPVCTKQGHPARIICFDKKTTDGHNIIALVKFDPKRESIMLYCNDGTSNDSESDRYNLVMAPTKHKGWINVCRAFEDTVVQHSIFKTKEAAKEASDRIIDTIEIEWEDEL